jgi:hypothetical protein
MKSVEDIAYFSIIDGNRNFTKVAKAWIYSARKSGVKNLFIYSLCPITADIIKNKFSDVHVRRVNLEALSDYDDAGRKRPFGHIPNAKVISSLELLEEFSSVIYCDLDAVFLKNPTQVFKELLESHDLLFSMALGTMRYPPGAAQKRGWVICSGCFGMSNTRSTKIFLSTMSSWFINGGGPTLKELRQVFSLKSGHVKKDLQSLMNFYFFNKEEWLPHHPSRERRFQENPSFTFGDLRLRLLSQAIVNRAPTKISGTPYMRHILAPCARSKIQKFKRDFPDFS